MESDAAAQGSFCHVSPCWLSLLKSTSTAYPRSLASAQEIISMSRGYAARKMCENYRERADQQDPGNAAPPVGRRRDPENLRCS